MKKEQFPSQKLDQYMLRFPDGMRDQLKAEAAKNNRSLNAEIIDRLELTLDYPLSEEGMWAVSRRLENSATYLEKIIHGLRDVIGVENLIKLMEQAKK